MLSHFLNVSFTLPQAFELDKGQDYWWLHVVFPYFILFSAHQGRGGGPSRKESGRPAREEADPCVFTLRTRIKRFNGETVGRRGETGSVNEEGMKILN